MKKEKKICIRITPRRLVSAILLATSALNLIIVGAVFEVTYSTATPAMSPLPTTLVPTTTFFVPTSTAWETFTPLFADTPTQTPSTTPTYTFTPTNTITQTPSVTPTYTSTLVKCIPQYSWPIYIVQGGDTLYFLALTIGSTVNELVLANCLPNDHIYIGQWLYVPRVPVRTPTPTPTLTETSLACAEFEDLKSGTAYKVGETFLSSGIHITIEPFVWGSGTPTSSGLAYVTDGKTAGGFGMEIQVNNITLTFNFPAPLSGLSLLFGEYGGNLNIDINGDFRNFENLADINQRDIGGAKISVLQGFGNDAGYLQLSGAIKSLAIGGQELWIDNVCLSR
jgi:LysM repeat protein